MEAPKTYGWELKLALRSLRRRFVTTVLVALVVGLAVGGNTAFFSFLYANLLRPLPYPDPDRLVLVSQGDHLRANQRNPVAAANFVDLAASLESVGSWAALRPDSPVLTGDRPEAISAPATTRDLLDLLGATPAHGRLFDADDSLPGAARVAVLAHDFWLSRYGGSEDVLGQTLRLDGVPFEIVGVLREGFVTFAPRARAYTALRRAGPDADRRRGTTSVFAVGRLSAGVDLAAANAQAVQLARELEAAHPVINRNLELRVVPLRSAFVPTPFDRRLLFMLQACLALVLLIACVNVASLQVVRGHESFAQLAIQRAFGASSTRLGVQTSMELAALMTLGTTVGLGFAALGIRRLTELQPEGLYVPRFDPAVTAAALGSTVAATLLAAAVPMMMLVRSSRLGHLTNARLMPRGRGRRSLPLRLLVAGQIGLATGLLAVTLVLVGGVRTLRSADSGFQPDNVLTLFTWLPDSRYGDGIADFYAELLPQLEALPGVVAAAATSHHPRHTAQIQFPYVAGQAPPPDLDAATRAVSIAVAHDYFRTFGIPLLQGRAFDSRDRDGAQRTVVVSEELARRTWGRESAVGQQIWSLVGPATVVGVAANVQQRAYFDRATMPDPVIYFPLEQSRGVRGAMTVALRTDGPPHALAEAAQSVIWSLDPELPVHGGPVTMHELLDRLTAWDHIYRDALGAFAFLAIALAALGVHGMLSLLALLRRFEMGVRVCVGATPGDVVKTLSREGLGTCALGAFLGAALVASTLPAVQAAGAGRLPISPEVAWWALPLAGTVCLLATLLPSARMALRLDPVTALRED